MKLKVLLSVVIISIVFYACNNKKCPVSIIAASYNLRNANHNDSVNGNGWGLRYPVIAGEHSAIFYRTDKFEVIDKGDFWMSETPDVPSKGWDAVLPRICSWGHFKCKDSGFEFLFFNLHMDHIGKNARVESALLVLKKMKEIGDGLPVILTGDFNVDQTHKSYDVLVNKWTLCDSYEKCDIRYATNGILIVSRKVV